MAFLQSIRAKAIAFSLGISAVVLLFGGLGLLNLNRIIASTNQAYAKTLAVRECLTQANAALQDSIHVGYEALTDVTDPQRFDELRKYEGRLKQATLDFDMYIQAITWGSESEVFGRLSGGLVQATWERGGLAGALVVAQVPADVQRLASQASLYHAGFSNNALESLRGYRRALRLEATDRATEAAAEFDRVEALRRKSRQYARLIQEVFGQIRSEVSRYLADSIAGIRETQRATIRDALAAFAFWVIFVTATCVLFLARVVVRPIQRLRWGAEAIGRGRLEPIEVPASGEIGQLAAAFNAMTHELRVSRDQLLAATAAERRRAAELARSNAELEQFAYVASHDLQEPLRMVASYTQLLARRYQGKLDEDADEFIRFAVDGAIRMQRLINDLLQYSRVGTAGRPFAPTACDAALGQALTNLRQAIDESGAVITRGALPTVMADESQLVQLFQNLIGNAIKFRTPSAPPQIEISAAPQEGWWRFQVRDDGIGFDPQHADRIFVVFQRLHTSEEYPGTGIGLAICKKIVERHGGRIWAVSSPGQGSTFSFTLPLAR